MFLQNNLQLQYQKKVSIKMDENGTTVRSIGTRRYHTNEISTYGNELMSEIIGTGIIHFHGTGQFSDGGEISSNDMGIEVNATNGIEGNIIVNGQNSIVNGQNSIVSEQNSIVNGQNSIVNEQNSIVNEQNSIANGQNIIGTRQNIIGTGQNIIGTENSQVNRHAWVESWFHSQFIPITNRQSSNGEGQPLLGRSGSSGNSGDSGNSGNSRNYRNSRYSRNQNEESFSEDFDMNSWTYCYVMSAGFVFWFAVILLFLGLLYLVLIGLSKISAWDS